MLRGMGVLKMSTPLHTPPLSPLLGAEGFLFSNASWRLLKMRKCNLRQPFSHLPHVEAVTGEAR
jgi:hypothetical protein